MQNDYLLLFHIQCTWGRFVNNLNHDINGNVSRPATPGLVYIIAKPNPFYLGIKYIMEIISNPKILDS